jgi:phosphonate transport system ATP-binding protein
VVPQAAALSVRGLVKEYVRGQPVLHGLTLDFGGTGLTAVIGASGTGKSTLLRCVNRLVEPTAGQIVFGGRDIVPLRGRALREARREIGMVFQEYNLVERLSVMENLLSGRLGYMPAWKAWLRRFPRGRHRARLPAAGPGGPGRAARTSGPMRCRAASASAWASRAR